MDFQKRVPDEFGLIYPTESGVRWIKQGGGMSCLQREIEGIYIPIGELRHNLGYPDWVPDGPNFGTKIRELDLNDVPDADYQTLQEDTKTRGHFKDYDEFSSWIEESERYGWITLWDDLFRFTYGIYDNLDSDPRNRWEDEEELWTTIDESLGFEYEMLTVDQLNELGCYRDYPGPEAAIRPIRISDGGDKSHKFDTNWAELEDEVLFMMCPNAD